MRGKEKFFFEKKNQKTFAHWAPERFNGTGQIIKVFFASFLFTKKKCLLAFDCDAP
jgi:hypothetical protein